MRVLVFLQLLIVFCVQASGAFALEVPVRTGAHSDYSRLVFDWPKTTGYTVKRTSSNTVEISFETNAALDGIKLRNNPISNMVELSVLSESPLRVSVKLAGDSRVKDFVVGDRVIMDVYNPPGAKPARKVLQITSASSGASPVANASPSKPPAAPAPSVEKTAINVDTKELEENPQVVVDVPQPKTVKLKPSAIPTLVTMSATKSFGLAAFENAGRLWIVNDKDDLLFTPQVSGPNAKALLPLQEIEAPNAKAYAFKTLPGTNIKGQGGGLIWRVAIAPEQKLKEPATPVRASLNGNIDEGGKLTWPLKTARNVIEIKDDLTGEKIFAVSVEEAKNFAGPARQFVEFAVLPSPIGLAIVPKVDDLKVKVIRGGVEISRPGGLAIVSESKAKAARNVLKTAKAPKLEHAGGTLGERIFDLRSWQLGGKKALPENRNIILGKLKDLSEGGKIENLLTLAKAYISNGVGPEALGILRLASAELPGLNKNAEFIALRGAARALSWQSEEAFADLSIDKLQKFPEIHLWRAHTLADLGDWQQAADILPEKFVALLHDYPNDVRNLLALSVSEILLRSGDTERAGDLLQMVEQEVKDLPLSQKSALKYLKGEKARQQDNLEDTKMYWSELAKGEDDLYRAKSGLALARLLVEEEDLPRGKAIDRLERLRYAWRGDDLEAQINYWLGQIYFDRGDHIKGLNIMREATTYASGTPLSQRIAQDMSNVFIGLFVGEKLEKVSPLDAVTLYEQFSELVPPDKRGDEIVEKLAEHLVQADLLERAGDLLNYQLNHRIEGYDAFRVATRLSAIRLLDKKPDQAMAVLNLADMKFKELPEELRTVENQRNLALLRARTLSQQGRPDQALAMLAEMQSNPDLNRLRADIAWGASYWDDAGEALRDVILDQNISLTRPLSAENAALLMQYAIALNLASDRVALANMREKYSDLMSQTEKAKVFEVITRPRKSSALADRETLLSVVSEVDLFTEILNDLKTVE